MNVVKVDERLTKVQNGLFERAHTEPCELKFLAVALKKQGIQGDKLFLHPEMMPLPMDECDYLSALSPRQKAILSAMSYANIYQFIAGSEIQTLSSNMFVADKVFTPYSDDYMVLYQETAEEYDHTWTFRTLHSLACKESGYKEAFNEVGFFRGEGGFTSNEAQNTSFGLKFLRFMIGDAIRLLPSNIVQGAGLGGLWLLYRYIANVSLKQSESYFFDMPESFSYEPLALEITKGHGTDEARHYTTSFDLGMELYRAADPLAQKFIRAFIKKVVENYITVFYRTYGEMVELADKGIMTTPYQIGLKSLHMALMHPEFADAQVDVKGLTRSWYAKQVGKELGPVAKKRWRYVSQQLERLVDALDLDLSADTLGQSYTRYQKAPDFAVA